MIPEVQATLHVEFRCSQMLRINEIECRKVSSNFMSKTFLKEITQNYGMFV